MSNDTFWLAIDRTLDQIEAEKPTTFDGVALALTDPALVADIEAAGATGPNASFFAGSGGDRSFLSALKVAGWRVRWIEADYYWVARHPVSGEVLTYCEGDVLRGDQSVSA